MGCSGQMQSRVPLAQRRPARGGFWGVLGGFWGVQGGGPPKWPFFGIFPFFGEFARKFMTRRWKNHRRHKFLDEFSPRTQKKYFCDGKILRPTFRGENFSARKTFPTNLPKPRAQKSDKMCTRKIWQICQNLHIDNLHKSDKMRTQNFLEIASMCEN